jgi:hypothetical protein
MSEVQSDGRAIYTGIPRISDRAKSSPLQERFLSAQRLR